MKSHGETVTRDEFEVFQSIGAHISELIEDGSTLQLGIGSNTGLLYWILRKQKRSGYTTEMFFRRND